MYVKLQKVKVVPMRLHSYLMDDGRENEMGWYPNSEGFMIIDSNGSKEWCEKIYFLENHYNMSKGIPFGIALEMAKEGEVITRKAWGDYRQYVFMRPGDEINMEMIPRIKSLPDNVKDNLIESDNETVSFTPYLCLKDNNGSIHNGWIPSTDDMLAADWIILDING